MIHLSVGCKTSVKHRKWCSVILNDWTINISLRLSLTGENSQISCSPVLELADLAFICWMRDVGCFSQGFGGDTNDK